MAIHYILSLQVMPKFYMLHDLLCQGNFIRKYFIEHIVHNNILLNNNQSLIQRQILDCEKKINIIFGHLKVNLLAI